MADDRWARLHRLYDPQDLIRDPEIAGDRMSGGLGGSSAASRGLSEEEFRRKIDEGDREREPEDR